MPLSKDAVKSRMLQNAYTIPNPGPLIFPPGPEGLYGAIAEAFVNTSVGGLVITCTYVGNTPSGSAVSTVVAGPSPEIFKQYCVDSLEGNGWSAANGIQMEQFVWGLTGMMEYVWESAGLLDPSPVGTAGTITAGGMVFNIAFFAAEMLTSLTAIGMGIILPMHVDPVTGKYTDPVTGQQLDVGDLFPAAKHLIEALGVACYGAFLLTSAIMVAPGAAPPSPGGATTTTVIA